MVQGYKERTCGCTRMVWWRRMDHRYRNLHKNIPFWSLWCIQNLQNVLIGNMTATFFISKSRFLCWFQIRWYGLKKSSKKNYRKVTSKKYWFVWIKHVWAYISTFKNFNATTCPINRIFSDIFQKWTFIALPISTVSLSAWILSEWSYRKNKKGVCYHPSW